MPTRILLVLDESGQWIEDSAGRLAQLQALVEEAAAQGQGRVWVFVTTHEDMGSIFQNARALQADMKKIEGRFRFKWSLTTENIEKVLEDRLLRKRTAGRDAVGKAYDAAPGVLRGLGELTRVEERRLPECDHERFVAFYPFLPYQIHLIPDILKGLRSKGGRGEQLSGSTRTLLAITQDILRVGRRKYLTATVGDLVSFDEVFENIRDSEVTPDVRKELLRIEEVVPDATAFTRRVAEVLFLLREVTYVPRTADNLARLLLEATDTDFAALLSRTKAELARLIKARMVAPMGEEYEYLTGERRTFEEAVAQVASEIRQGELEAGFAKHFVYDADEGKNHLREVLGFETVPFKGAEFEVRVSMDGTYALRKGHIEVRIYSPLHVALGGTRVAEVVDQSLRTDETRTIFVVCERVPQFDQELRRYLAMRDVAVRWKGDSHRSEESRRLAEERESGDVRRLASHLRAAIREARRSRLAA